MAYFVYRTHKWAGDFLVTIGDKPKSVEQCPGIYFPHYEGEFESYNDPREAVEAAIRIRDAWRVDRVGKIDPTPEDIRIDGDDDGDDDAGTREWAEYEWNANMPAGN